jgi:pectate lyase
MIDIAHRLFSLDMPHEPPATSAEPPRLTWLTMVLLIIAAGGCGGENKSPYNPEGTGGANIGSGGAGTTTGGGAGAGTAGAGGDGNAGGENDSGGAGAGGAGGSGGESDSGAFDVNDPCAFPPPASALVGWAAVDAMGQNGTTGGGDAAPIRVNTDANFMSAVAGTTPRVIYVTGRLSGSFGIGSHKTIVGLCGAQIHGHLELSRSVNVIVRNLTVVGNNCTDSPADCSEGADAITVSNGAHHIWFDHDDVYDGSDGNLDVISGSDFVTISWTKFHYSTARTDPLAGASGHRYSNLIGSADDVPADVGHLNVTFHHDWWAENVDQRMPRDRNGKIHVFNNLFTSVGNRYCTNAGFQASLLVENNVYIGVNNPLSPDRNGDMLARGNLFENTSGTQAATGMGFVPDYPYTAEPTADLAEAIRREAGPH